MTVAEIMKKQEVTQRDLAAACGLYQSDISAIVNGKVPSDERKGKIAVALGVAVEDLEWSNTDRSTVFIVTGSTGEYSDRRDWTVAAYLSEKQAQAHCLALEEWLRVNKMHMDSPDLADWQARDMGCPLDPAFSCDYTGTRYWVAGVPLHARYQPTISIEPVAATEGSEDR